MPGPCSREFCSVLRDLLDDLAGARVVPVAGDVRLGEDSDESVALDDRQPSNLPLGEQLERPVEVLVRRHGAQVGRRDLADRCALRIQTLGDGR